ncbi:netrin receptor DCC-like, partial [Acanthaster planci]|uniref:Netrin receptor DCC-like n=1 Tax=Acanthaster planci TaxID=133434 RepID=A0A8B8A467_ACAPL
CNEGTFGADCQQTCHCVSGGTCSKDTGECSMGCEASYFGTNCQCSIQNGVLGLEVTSGDPHQLFVTWQPDPCVSGYELTTRDECEDIVYQEMTLENAYHFITGLESPLSHRVYMRPVYPGNERGPEVTFPQITKPTMAPVDVNFTSATPYSLSVSWSKPPCGSRGGIITGYTYKLTEVSPESQAVIQSVTSDESVTIEGLTPLTEYSFQVAANTTVGAGPYSQASNKTTSKAPAVDDTPVPDSSSAVAGAVVATIVILILLVIVPIVLYKRRTRQTKQPLDIDGDVPLKGRDAHFLPDQKPENPPSAYATVNPVEIYPEPPPTPKPKPDLKPRWVSTNSPKETLEQPVVDEDEEELPYAELPSVREENLAEYIRSKDKAGKKGFPTDFQKRYY